MIILALVFAALASPASAHEGGVWSVGGVWTTDPFITVPLYATALLYLLGANRLWRRAGHGRGVRQWQAACFWVGWTSLALALVSPLHWLGERLFTAHMIEHEILMGVAAPLLAVSRPVGAFLWALPMRWRIAVGQAAQLPAAAALWRAISHPLAATGLHGIALWAWHAPALYNRALASPGLHWVQHASFLFTGILFWWALVFGRMRRRGFGAAAFYLFFTALHTGVLGILLTVSRRLWYPDQGSFSAEWGLTPLEDQQLAGLVMWVPGGLVYAAAALALAGFWISRSAARPMQGATRAPA